MSLLFLYFDFLAFFRSGAYFVVGITWALRGFSRERGGPLLASSPVLSVSSCLGEVCRLFFLVRCDGVHLAVPFALVGWTTPPSAIVQNIFFSLAGELHFSEAAVIGLTLL